MFRVLFSTLCLTFGAFIGANCEKNCDTSGILIYEDLGCKVIKKDKDDCPIQYECDDFTRKNDSCLFRGKTYTQNQQISDDLTYGSCSVGCFCGNYQDQGPSKFTCAVLDCPEWLGAPIQPGCYRRFEPNKCCSVGMICPSEGTPLAECTVNGKTYKEGEKFFPENTCSKCACGKNWKGKLEEPFCSRSLCNSQLDRAEELDKRCAPCYFGKETLCCPDTWVCPSSSDHIKKVNNNVDSNSELTCVFGSKTLKLGQGFQTKVSHYDTEKNVQCECAVPPLLTCKEV